MDIRMKAFGKMLAFVTVIFGGNFAINWLFPVYGAMIVLSIVLVYFMYLIYGIYLDQLKYEEIEKSQTK